MKNNKPNRNESFNWLQDKPNFFVDEKILNYNSPIRGIYGIFIKNKNEDKKCVYVGRSTNIYYRIFNSYSGHISNIKKKEHFISELNEANEDVDIKVFVEVLEEVTFEFDNYHKDMQRLASAENYYIDRYQSRNQCLNQVPEGTHMTLKEWENKKEEKSKL